MELITVREIFAQPDAYMDKEVTIGGWIRSIRDSKTFGFKNNIKSLPLYAAFLINDS